MAGYLSSLCCYRLHDLKRPISKLITLTRRYSVNIIHDMSQVGYTTSATIKSNRIRLFESVRKANKRQTKASLASHLVIRQFRIEMEIMDSTVIYGDNL